jgi:imidazoleglycerol-phosphate dehydratase
MNDHSKMRNSKNRYHQLTWAVDQEASVRASVDIDGQGISNVDCGHKTLNHFIGTFARYSRFDIEISVKGDSIPHHIFEQSGIALGLALDSCLSDRKNLRMFASVCVPVDNTAVEVVVDINQKPGRLYFRQQIFELSQYHDGIEVSCYIHFLEKMAAHANVNIHVLTLYAEDIHHAIETLYKAVAVALYEASRFEPKPILRLTKEVRH